MLPQEEELALSIGNIGELGRDKCIQEA